MTQQTELISKLVAVSKEIGFLEFDKNNASQGYKYTSAASVIRKLNVELAKHGLLAYVSEETINNFQEFVNNKGNKNVLCTVSCGITFTDGTSSITARGSGSGMDIGDKAVMKASTVAYKYAIAHALTLGWDAVDPEDDSGDTPRSAASTGTGKPASKGKGKAPKAAAKPPQEDTTAQEGPSLEERIAKADTEAQLDLLRPEIIAVKAKDESRFATLKQAVIDRRAALQGS